MRLETETGGVVCELGVLADTPLRRMKGLLGRRSLLPGEGLLLKPAGSIHTWFMRFSIDAVFLDGDLRVLDVRHDVRPWRTALRRGAKSVLELPSGEAARVGVTPGEQLRLL